MTHNEILDSFFSRTFDTEIHARILQEQDYVLPVEDIRQYMVALTDISLTEYFNFLDNHQQLLNTEGCIAAYSSNLEACTGQLCQVLYEDAVHGKSAGEIGKSAIFRSYLRVHNKDSWSRCGNKQAKAGRMLGLAFKNERQWHLSCFGYSYVMPMLNERQQYKFLNRALLRNPFYARILCDVRTEEVVVAKYMEGLSASTQGSKSGSIAKMLRICLDEMDREGIRWHDIHLPKYNARKKTAGTYSLAGTKRAVDDYELKDEYFNGAIPLYTVKAACGYFVEHEIPEQEGWMDLTGVGMRTNSKDFFIVHAKGDSMLPKIKDGDLCLFKWYKGEALYDDIVLTQCRDYDAEYESSYTIKKFHQNELKEGKPRSIALQPLNKSKYHPIILSEDDGCDYKTIGILVKVL